METLPEKTLENGWHERFSGRYIMKRITGKYALSKDDPHYKKRQSRTISPKDCITKMYIENKQTRYIIWFRCADRVMKITQITYMPGSQTQRKESLWLRRVIKNTKDSITITRLHGA